VLELSGYDVFRGGIKSRESRRWECDHCSSLLELSPVAYVDHVKFCLEEHINRLMVRFHGWNWQY
jgi:hypothetical protein